MRKQTIASIVVAAILLVLAIAYTLSYAYFNLHLIDQWRSILLVLLWAAVAVVIVGIFVERYHTREELLRRYYLSPDWIYNHEIGYAKLSQVIPDADAYEFVTFAADSLIEMSYGFEVAETPESFEPKFMVATKVFKVRRTGDGAVVSQWKGSLNRVVSDPDGTRGTFELGEFDNAAELAQLLEENEALS
jgi:hypothetical protein